MGKVCTLLAVVVIAVGLAACSSSERIVHEKGGECMHKSSEHIVGIQVESDEWPCDQGGR